MYAPNSAGFLERQESTRMCLRRMALSFQEGKTKGDGYGLELGDDCSLLTLSIRFWYNSSCSSKRTWTTRMQFSKETYRSLILLSSLQTTMDRPGKSTT